MGARRKRRKEPANTETSRRGDLIWTERAPTGETSRGSGTGEALTKDLAHLFSESQKETGEKAELRKCYKE